MRFSPVSEAGPRASSGFSLVEAIVALGLLAAVLLAIGTTFVLGGRQVRAGRTLTAATTLATDILESLERRSFAGVYGFAGAGASAVSATVSSREPGSVLAPWQAEIDRILGEGSASLAMAPLGTGAPSFGEAAGLGIVVTVSWQELGRPRQVRLKTARF